MKIEIPRLRIGLKKHDLIVSEQIVRAYLHLAFWLSPLAFIKLAEILKAKGWLG